MAVGGFEAARVCLHVDDIGRQIKSRGREEREAGSFKILALELKSIIVRGLGRCPQVSAIWRCLRGSSEWQAGADQSVDELCIDPVRLASFVRFAKLAFEHVLLLGPFV